MKIKIAALLLITFGCLSFSCEKKAVNEEEVVEEEPITEIETEETFPNPEIEANPLVDYTKWKIENGKFYLDGEWVFLKIAKPLTDFGNATAVDRLINDLNILRSKYYNTIELNCYWHHFDTDGDGVIDVSLDPLIRLVDAIYEKGMYPCISVETYSVGGGQIPSGFWESHPDAFAIDVTGTQVTDTEYGFGSNVVSIFYPEYRTNSHKFIKNLVSGIDVNKVLYFETTVEPQYMGTRNLDYSEAAKEAYSAWRTENNITDTASEMPTSFPIPEAFITNETWNKFRAQALAEWVSSDAAAFREVAGEDSYIAMDYLDAAEADQLNRTGDPIEFLANIEGINIVQVNWTWYFPTNTPNNKAYDRVHEVNEQYERNWAITEHMTFNGNSYVSYSEDRLKVILNNTLEQGTRFGWEFVNVKNITEDSFSMYHTSWAPKPVIKVVDDNWGYWLNKIKRIEDGN